MSVALDEARIVRVRLDTPEGRAVRQALGLEETVPELVRAYCLGEWKAAGEDGQRPVLITTDDEDRMGDIIVPEGAILEHYRKNPVILWAHDYTLPPIGSAQWIKKTDHGIFAKPRWASTEFAQQIRLLYDEGHMKAWSIGFLPKAWEDIQSKDPSKPGVTGRRYTKWELLEFSAVPVPANPHALSLAVAKGLTLSEPLRAQLQVSMPELPLEEQMRWDAAQSNEFSFRETMEVWISGEAGQHWVGYALRVADERTPTVVQTLIFSKEVFKTAESAQTWAKEHDFQHDKVDETDDSWRLRQRDPGDFDPESFRTITLTTGVQAVVGHLKKGAQAVIGPDREDAAAADAATPDLTQMRTELADVKVGLAAAVQRIHALETERGDAVRIRIAVDGDAESRAEPVIRVAGASLTKAELAKVLGDAIDGRIRTLTGVVS